MKWKTLGKALLVTCGLFGLCALIIILGHYFPWLIAAIGFISVIALTYNAMRSSDYDTDNDRMAWFSDDEKKEEESK